MDTHNAFAYAFVFNTEKNGGEGGVWGAGYKLPIDDDGFMYLSAGNGDWTNNVDANGFPIDGKSSWSKEFELLHTLLQSQSE